MSSDQGVGSKIERVLAVLVGRRLVRADLGALFEVAAQVTSDVWSMVLSNTRRKPRTTRKRPRGREEDTCRPGTSKRTRV